MKGRWVYRLAQFFHQAVICVKRLRRASQGCMHGARGRCGDSASFVLADRRVIDSTARPHKPTLSFFCIPSGAWKKLGRCQGDHTPPLLGFTARIHLQISNQIRSLTSPAICYSNRIKPLWTLSPSALIPAKAWTARMFSDGKEEQNERSRAYGFQSRSHSDSVVNQLRKGFSIQGFKSRHKTHVASTGHNVQIGDCFSGTAGSASFICTVTIYPYTLYGQKSADAWSPHLHYVLFLLYIYIYIFVFI